MELTKVKIDGLVQDCSNSIANALELLQSCTEPWKCLYMMLCVYPCSIVSIHIQIHI